MTKFGGMNTNATAAETTTDLRRLFDKWGRASGSTFVLAVRRPVKEARSIYGTATVTVFRDGQEFGPFVCAKFDLYAANLRSVYGWLDALRLADARGMLRELVEAGEAFLALPAAGQSTAAATMTATAPDPWVVLGVERGAPLTAVEFAWTRRVKAARLNYDEVEVKRLNVARDAVRQQQQQQQAAALAGRGGLASR